MAAVELADGVALSKTSFWRTISRSPSSGGREQSAVVDVPEVVEHRVGDGRRLGDPHRFAGRLGEPDEGIGERGVVGGEGVVTSPRLAALVPGPPPPAVVGA